MTQRVERWLSEKQFAEAVVSSEAARQPEEVSSSGGRFLQRSKYIIPEKKATRYLEILLCASSGSPGGGRARSASAENDMIEDSPGARENIASNFS